MSFRRDGNVIREGSKHVVNETSLVQMYPLSNLEMKYK